MFYYASSTAISTVYVTDLATATSNDNATRVLGLNRPEAERWARMVAAPRRVPPVGWFDRNDVPLELRSVAPSPTRRATAPQVHLGNRGDRRGHQQRVAVRTGAM